MITYAYNDQTILLDLAVGYLQPAFKPSGFFFICRDLIFLLDPYLFPFPPFPRATASEELEEGPWQVSMVPPEVDEITAEHCPDVKVSSTPKLQW